MASLWTVWGILFMLMAYFSSVAKSSSVQYPTISAAPAILPSAPLPSSPSLPPDIQPLWPTPKGMAPTPTPTHSSLLPTIPSSRSPPNPENVLNPAPGFALSPSSASNLPASTSVSVSVSVSLTSAGALNSTLFLGFLVLGLLQMQQLFSGV